MVYDETARRVASFVTFKVSLGDSLLLFCCLAQVTCNLCKFKHAQQKTACKERVVTPQNYLQQPSQVQFLHIKSKLDVFQRDVFCLCRYTRLFKADLYSLGLLEATRGG